MPISNLTLCYQKNNDRSAVTILNIIDSTNLRGAVVKGLATETAKFQSKSGLEYCKPDRNVTVRGTPGGPHGNALIRGGGGEMARR